MACNYGQLGETMTQIKFMTLAAARNVDPVQFDLAIKASLQQAVDAVGLSVAIRAMSPSKQYIQKSCLIRRLSMVNPLSAGFILSIPDAALPVVQ